MEEKRCVFDAKGTHCNALIKKSCENCAFIKKHSELMRGRERARKRLQGLNNGRILTEKYYKKGVF